jgi:nucleoid DNA-binding protein
MSRTHWILTALIAAGVALYALTGSAQSQRPLLIQPTLAKDVALESGVSEEDTAKVLNALGSVVRKQIATGRPRIELPGIGTFRVIRAPEHRALQDGKQIMVPGSNYIELVTDVGLKQAANSPLAVPAEIIPIWNNYDPEPSRVQGQRVPSGRVEPARINTGRIP